MIIPGNGLGRFGLAGLTLAGMAAIWWGITRYGGMLNINTRGEQVLAFVQVCLALVFVFYLPAMSRRVKESLYRRQSQQASVLPGEEGRVALTPPHHITVGGNSPDSTLSVWTRLVPQSPYSADNWLSQRRRTTDPKAHAGTLAGRSRYIIAVGWRPWGSGR